MPVVALIAGARRERQRAGCSRRADVEGQYLTGLVWPRGNVGREVKDGLRSRVLSNCRRISSNRERRRIVDGRHVNRHRVRRWIEIGAAAVVLHLEGEGRVRSAELIGHRRELQQTAVDVGHWNKVAGVDRNVVIRQAFRRWAA